MIKDLKWNKEKKKLYLLVSSFFIAANIVWNKTEWL